VVSPRRGKGRDPLLGLSGEALKRELDARSPGWEQGVYTDFSQRYGADPTTFDYSLAYASLRQKGFGHSAAVKGAQQQVYGEVRSPKPGGETVYNRRMSVLPLSSELPLAAPPASAAGGGAPPRKPPESPQRQPSPMNFFRRSPARDAAQRELNNPLRLWDIFKSEAGQGRASGLYADNHVDPQTGLHLHGHPLVNAAKRSDIVPMLAEGLGRIFNRSETIQKRRGRIDQLNDSPALDEKVTMIGRPAPEIRDQLQPVGAAGQLARNAAQVAGVATRDTMNQGLLGLYWFANAAEALASLGGQVAQYGALHSSRGRRLPGTKVVVGARDAVSPATIQSDVYRTPGTGIFASMPLIGLVGLAGGSFMRKEGYKAVLPEEGEGADPRESANLPGEIFMRTVGRHGGLLAYGDFVQERPDVSHGQYTAYQAYLQGNKSLIKGTMEGIHGPEVNLFGKSLPVLTGLIPLAAAAYGARRGYRMAGNRLAGRDLLGRSPAGSRGVDQFRRLEDLATDVDNARTAIREVSTKGGDGAAEAIADATQALEKAQARQTRAQRTLDNRLALGGILGASAAILPTVAVTQGLEQVRRANNWQENREAVAVSVLEAEEQRREEAEAEARAAAATGRLAGLTTLQGQ
jgi:hypothetical protein